MSASKERIARKLRTGGILTEFPKDGRIKSGPYALGDGRQFVELSDGRLAPWVVVGHVWDGNKFVVKAVIG